MTDQLERDLTALFQDRATATDVPPLPLDRIASAGARASATRRRRTGIAAAVAAAVVVVAIAVPAALLGSHDGAVPPIADDGPSPTNAVAPPALPYLHRGVLYADGRQVAAPGADYLEATGDTTLVGYWTPPGHITWSVLRGDGLVRLPYLDDQSSPALSADGSEAAAVTNPTPLTTRVAVYDLASGRMSAHIDLDVPRTCCDGGAVQAVTFAADGRLYWLQGVGFHVWRPGSATAPQLQVEHPIYQVGPAGPIVAVGNGGRVGTVDADGRFTPGRRLPVDQSALFSPDGREIAFEVDDQLAAKTGTTAYGPTVMDADTGRPVALHLTGTFARWDGFEDDGHVLVTTTGAGTHLERCDTGAGSCEPVMDLPGSPDSWVFP